MMMLSLSLLFQREIARFILSYLYWTVQVLIVLNEYARVLFVIFVFTYSVVVYVVVNNDEKDIFG